MKTNWHNKFAVITGASSGIGAAIARELSTRGLRVLLVARRTARLEELAGGIRSRGGQADVLSADLSDELERAALSRTIQQAYPPVDVLVNNAGLGWYGYTAEMPWDVAQNMLRVNVAAVVQLTLALLPGMRSRHSGHIINIGSIAGSLPEQGVALYAATKSFLDSFTTALHREMRGSGVHAGILRPGPVESEFFETSARHSQGRRTPAEKLTVPAALVANGVWRMLRRPRRVLYVPGILAAAPLLEFTFGWLIDRLGPLLLKRSPA